MKKLLTLFTFICSLALFSVSAQSLDYDAIAPHPRLLLTKGDVSKIRELPTKSANAMTIHQMIISEADGYLNAEPIKREIVEGAKWSAPREALKRVFYLSYAHAMTDDMRYVAAAEREMLAASAFEDWNPSHFLDVAEMTMALSIGYDWLYRRLSVRSRSIIGTAIYEKGLRASEGEGVNFWEREDNWNQVCNAGMIYGALATLERSPEYCKALISKCIESNKKAQKIYEPDGAYPEGYAYWEYGSGFEALLVAALESSLSTHAGIADNKNFLRSAEFMNHLVAPSGKLFNYGDCSYDTATCMPAKYWFARKMGNSSIVALDEKSIKDKKVTKDALLPLYMICAINLDLSNPQLPTQKSWQSRGEVPIYIYRSGWDADDAYFAIKGGKAQNNHSHMDAGSFVYELNGVRWATDLGGEDYSKLKAAGVDAENTTQQSNRWDVFSIGAASHNTLTFNGTHHNVGGKAEILKFHDTPREKGAELDLTPIFAEHAQSVTRTVMLNKKNHLTVTDNIQNGVSPSTVEWHMTTTAAAEIVSPQMIMLTQEGKTLYLRLKARSRATAKIWPADEKSKGAARVGFIVELKSGEDATLEVTMSPTKPNVISRIKQTVLK